MNILFITYDEVSLCSDGVRTVAMLYALADAGHRVHLFTPHYDLPDHPCIQVPDPARRRTMRRSTLRIAALRAAGRGRFDAVHAVDDAVVAAARISRLRKIPLVYDAAGCRRISEGCGAGRMARLFPDSFRRLEGRLLQRTAAVLSPCTALSAELKQAGRGARIVQLEDIPAQPLHARRHEAVPLLAVPPGPHPRYRIVCSALPDPAVGWKTLFMALRKVVESEPGTMFLFRGIQPAAAEKLADSLDIRNACRFLPPRDPAAFLEAIDSADAILMLPRRSSRFIDPHVYTLLQAPAPLVTIINPAYDEILTDKTSIRVLPDTDAIAAGLLRSLHEPLFSLAVALEGRQLVADRHAYSSFKHKVRMAYHELRDA